MLGGTPRAPLALSVYATQFESLDFLVDHLLDAGLTQLQALFATLRHIGIGIERCLLAVEPLHHVNLNLNLPQFR